MMLPSHLLATLLLGLVASRVRRFEPRDWVLALAFGVLIDLDHLLHFPAYLAANGTAAWDPATMLATGSAWQGIMHTPWALLVVLPACLLYRSGIPLAFWGLHMVQDFVIARHYVRFGGPVEWAIVAALLALTLVAFRAHHAREGHDAPFARHVAATLGIFPRAALNPFRRE